MDRPVLAPAHLPAGFFQSLTRVAPIGIFQTDADGQTVYVNERWTEMSGLTLAESCGTGWARAIVAEDRAAVTDEWSRAVAERREFAKDFRVMRPDGEIRYVHARGIPVLTRNGTVRGYIGAVEDDTARALAERNLEAARHELSRRRLEALFEYSLDAIVLFNDRGEYVEANPAACQLFGCARDELLQRCITDVLTPESHESFGALWSRFLAEGEQVGEHPVIGLDGSRRTIEFRAVANVLPHTHLSILRDVTDRKRAERAVQDYVKRLETLAAIDTAILEARSASTIAEGVVARISTLFRAVRVSVLLADDAAGTAQLAAVWSTGPTQLASGATFPLRDDTTGAEVLHGRQFIVANLAAEPNRTWVDDVLGREGVRSYLRVPMRTPSAVIGSLNISAAEVDAFNSEHLAVAQEIADRLAVAITNARTTEALQAAHHRASALSKRLLELQERERRDIARELHDEIGQVVTGIKLRLDMLARQVRPDLAPRLAETDHLVDDLIANVRRLSLNLRPPLLDEFGLQAALAAHIERFTNQTGVHVDFTCGDVGAHRQSSAIEIAAFRIVQESLTNVARHAGVDRVSVQIVISPGRLYVAVADRGAGFDRAAVPADRLGLRGMQERVELLGGTLAIRSRPGEGTTIVAQLPLGPEEPS